MEGCVPLNSGLFQLVACDEGKGGSEQISEQTSKACKSREALPRCRGESFSPRRRAARDTAPAFR